APRPPGGRVPPASPGGGSNGHPGVSEVRVDLANDADEPGDSTDDPAYGDATGAPARTNARSLTRAGLVVSATYLVSRLLGYVRVLLVTTTFGAGHELDSF